MGQKLKLIAISFVLLSFAPVMTGCKEKGRGASDQLAALAGLLGADQPGENRVPEIVQVSSSAKAQGVGTKQQLSAIGIDSNYNKFDASKVLDWSSSNPEVATVDEAGVVTAVGAGKATIIGKSRKGKQASGSVEVEVHTAHIEHIAVTPSVPVCMPEELAEHHEEDGDDGKEHHEDDKDGKDHHEDDKDVSKESSDKDKKVEKEKKGDHESGDRDEDEKDDDDDDDHDDDCLVNLVSPSIVAGTTQTLFAMAEFSNDTVQDVTPFVKWSSSNPVVATVSNDPGSQGVATGVSAGVAMIIATDPATGKTGAIQLTVTAPVLKSIVLTPPGMSIPNGTSGQIVAQGLYSNGTSQNITTSLVWSTGDAAVATVASGLVTGLGVGTVQITATDSAGGVSAVASVTITAAELVSIAVNPPTASIPSGLMQRYSAMGSYTDKSVRDLTREVTWTSSNTMIASVSNVWGREGVVHGTGVGTATIYATMPAGPYTAPACDPTRTKVCAQPVPEAPAQQVPKCDPVTGVCAEQPVAPVGAAPAPSTVNPAVISGSATLNVTAAVLSSISVSPASALIPLNGSMRFSATGRYTDGRAADMTTLVTWTGSPTVTVSNAPGTQGMATGAAPGLGTVTASDPVSRLSGTASVTVAVMYNNENVYVGVPSVRRGTVSNTGYSQYHTPYAGVTNITLSGMSGDVDLFVDRHYSYPSCYQRSYCCGFLCWGTCYETICNTYWTNQRMCNAMQAGLAAESCNTAGLPGYYNIYVTGNKTGYGAAFDLSVR